MPTCFLLNLVQQHWPELLDPPESFLSGGNCLFCVRVWLHAESLNVNFVCVCVFVCFVIAVLLCVKKGVCLLGQEYAMKLTLTLRGNGT